MGGNMIKYIFIRSSNVNIGVFGKKDHLKYAVI